MAKRYTLILADDPTTKLFESDSITEARKVATIRALTYGDRSQLRRNKDGWLDALDGFGWRPPVEFRIALEQSGPAAIQDAIAADPDATRRVLRYLEARGIEHSGQISAGTLIKVCGRQRRSWFRWLEGDREFPIETGRLLVAVAFGAV